MIRILFFLAFIIGAAAIVAMSMVFAGSDKLALGVTLLIALAYSIGALELLHFHKATQGLQAALPKLPDFNSTESENALLDRWLTTLPAALKFSVHSRIEGETKGLPAPVLTPYLVGLLVMLGLLGTFVGMVDTLQGSVIALQGSTDLASIRDGLAAPIKGLGLAFGTSVAGVAASAMLGLMSTLSRRERILVTRELDAKINTVLRRFSLNFNRQETYKALQQQAQALPEVARQMSQMASHLESIGQRIEQQLNRKQDQFHQQAQQSYTQLADSVGQTLNNVLQNSAEVIAGRMSPLIEGLLTQSQNTLQAGAESTQQALLSLQEKHLTQVTQALQETTRAVNQSWEQGVVSTGKRLEAHIDKLEQSSETLLSQRQQAESAWQQAHVQVIASMDQHLQQALSELREQEQSRSDKAFSQLEKLEVTAAEHLAALGVSLEAPMTRLIETASAAPQAAAEVITKLKQEMTENLSRDNALLEERRRIMADLERVSDSLAQSTLNQGQAMETLLQSSGEKLAAISERFEHRVQEGMSQFASVAEQFTESTLDIASMSEGFVQAVSQFSESNDKLVANLNQIEHALNDASVRNDEQLAYYVAQAREIIDHSLLSQKQIIDDINKLALKQSEALDA